MVATKPALTSRNANLSGSQVPGVSVGQDKDATREIRNQNSKTKMRLGGTGPVGCNLRIDGCVEQMLPRIVAVQRGIAQAGGDEKEQKPNAKLSKNSP